jgi:hypothetical protein
MQQHALIKFYFKSEKTATKEHKDLKNVYDDDCLSRAQVFRWFARFLEGRTSLEDDRRPGQSDTARSNKNVEKTRAIFTQDRRITTRLLAEHFGVGKEAARQILGRDLKERKISSKYVQHSLRQYGGRIGLSVVAVSSSLLTNVVSVTKNYDC